MVLKTCFSRFTPGKDPLPTAQKSGWAPGPVQTSAENLAPTGIRSLDRPGHSQSLYRLCHPVPVTLVRIAGRIPISKTIIPNTT